MPSDARESSSVAMTEAMYSPSPPSLKPPYSEGTLRPNAPMSASPAMMSSGTSSLYRCTCSARGAMTLAPNDRNVSWIISDSSSRRRGPGFSASDARNPGSRKRATNDSVPDNCEAPTPHMDSRPTRRDTKSATMSAVKAHAIAASVSPVAPHSMSEAAVSTAAATWARS